MHRGCSVLTKIFNQQKPTLSQTRPLFRWLNVIFNKVDEGRIKEFGPDVAAAEWLLRNGAHAKWQKFGSSKDYDELMESDHLMRDHIIEIDATQSSINHVGFPYLKNLKYVNKIIFNETKFLNDKALMLLSEYNPASLKHLEIISCNEVTDDGILSLKGLTFLSYLKLQNMNSVSDKDNCLSVLKSSLKNCNIDWI